MPSKSKTSRSNEKDSSAMNRILISSVIGTVIFFAFISLFSLVILKSDAFSQSMYMPLGLVSGVLSSYLCGFIAVRPVRKKGVVTGALSGVVQALICSAAVFFINDNNSGFGIFILMSVIIIFASLGGISAVNVKIKKKY